MVTQAYPIRCRIRAEAGVTRVDVYDDIGEGGWFSEGLTAKSFAAQLKDVKGALSVHINSAGGDVFDGIAIGNAIRAHKGPVSTVTEGLAASIASVIAQAGQERVMQPGSMMMIHDAFGLCMGNAAEMAKMAETLGQVSDNLAEIYASRAGGTQAAWRDSMKQETWYTAEEAVAAGLADRVGDGAAELPAGMDLAAFTAVPGRIAARLRSMPQAQAPAIVGADGNHAPMSGSHSHAHPAYGSQGGDTSHAHDHSHDGDANHNHSHAPATEDRGGRPRNAPGKPYEPVPYRREPDETVQCPVCRKFNDVDATYCDQCGTKLAGRDDVEETSGPGTAAALSPDAVRAVIREELAAAGLTPGADGFPRPVNAVDNSPWDASKAWHNGAESDDPAAFYAGICAGKKDGDKATQAAWALPYKYHPGDAPNAAGTKAALSRLPQTEGLTNEAEAKATLQKAMKQVNPDYEPDDHAREGISAADAVERYRAALKGARA